MPRFRFSYALAGALALHAALLLVRTRHRPDLAHPTEPGATPTQIEIDELSEVLAPSVPQAALAPPEPNEALPAARVAALQPATAAGPASAPPSDAVLTPEVEAGPAPGVASAEPVANGAPARPIDLGLDGRMFMHLPSGANAGTEPTVDRPAAPLAPLGPRAPHSDVQRQLQASLVADDVKRGLARGNVFIGSLNTAARAEGPLRGEALVRVTVGADGSLLGIELASGAAADWAATVRSFRELATRKRVKVPPGARGMRISFAVKAKVQRPSGKEVQSSAVGVDTPSLKPNGLVPGGDFDLADLGGGGQRLVYARIVSEEVL